MNHTQTFSSTGFVECPFETQAPVTEQIITSLLYDSFSSLILDFGVSEVAQVCLAQLLFLLEDKKKLVTSEAAENLFLKHFHFDAFGIWSSKRFANSKSFD